MNRSQLTDRQREIYEFVKLYMEKNQMPPTRQEIAAAFEFSSVTSAQQHLEAIAKKGWLIIRHVPGMRGRRGRVSRGIALA